MNKTILLMVFVLALSPSVLAVSVGDVNDIFPVNSKIDYSKSCINNGTYCSSSAVCNLTVFYPNNSKLVNNQQMTNNFNYHNFTIQEIRKLGIYRADMVCKDGGFSGSKSYLFQVNPTGDESNGVSVAVKMMILLGTLILGGFFFFLSNYKLGEAEEKPASRFFFMGLAVIMVIFFVGIAMSVTLSELGEGSFADMVRALMTVMIIVLIILSVFTMFRLTRYAMDQFKLKRGLKV